MRLLSIEEYGISDLCAWFNKGDEISTQIILPITSFALSNNRLFVSILLRAAKYLPVL